MISRSRSGNSRSKADKKKHSQKRSVQRSLQSPALAAQGATTVPPPPPSPDEELAADIILERKAAFEAALALDGSGDKTNSGNRVKAFYECMEESLGLCDTLIAEPELTPPIACKRGCIYCCSNQVSLSEPEALYLGFHLLETRSTQQLRELRTRAQAMAAAFEGKTRQEIGAQRHLYPCLLLGEGTCAAYAARPLVCRGWNSVNAEMCAYSNQSHDAQAPIENHPVLRLMAESVQLGLLKGAQARGLEAGFLLLIRALCLLLEGDMEQTMIQRTDDWLNGRPFFALKQNC